MMKRVLSIATCLLSTALCGQDVLPLKLNDVWNVYLGVAASSSAADSGAPKSEDGREIPPKTARMTDSTINLATLNGSFETGSCAILRNEFESEKAGLVKAGASADWWMEIAVNGKIVYSTMNKGNGSNGYKPDDHVFSFPVKAGRNLLSVKVKSGSEGWRFVMGVPAAPPPDVKFAADSEWRPIGQVDLFVKDGSALDQSFFSGLPSGSSKSMPRLIVGPTGRLVQEDAPDKPVKLRSSNMNFPWVLGRAKKTKDWKAYFDENIQGARRQGYNALRLNPAISMCYRTSEALDMEDYFMAKLGENGMYCLLDCFLDGDIRKSWEPGLGRMDTTLRMYLGDEIVRASWKRATTFMMEHVNKYTGVAWKDDPAIACMILYNEQEWGFFHPKKSLRPETQVEFDVKFRQWLERKYKDYGALAKAWGESSLKSFADVETPASFPVGGKSARDNDFILFCAELSRESAAWMGDTLRASGYKGLISQYNISQWLGGQLAKWEKSQVCIANTYHNHPTSFDNPGSRCAQNSSIGAGIWYWRGVASTRFADRPFVETEFNHSFWNPYQYECGAVFGAYSALQGFDGLSIHGGAVFNVARRPGLGAFDVGSSPIARAGEFLLNCLYLRGDVKPASHRVELSIPKEYLEVDCDAGRSVSGEQGKIAFMTGFSVAFPWAKPAEGVGVAAKPDITISPSDGSAFKSAGGGWAIDGVDTKDGKFSIDAFVKAMKAKGVLPKDNISDPGNGIFQSETGEIVMRTKENLLKIATRRSEAVALEAGKGERVGALNVAASSVPALVAACSMDKSDAALESSKRVVLIYSTYAVNSGMTLSADRSTLVDIGKLPVLLRGGKLDLTLKNSNGAKCSLYALDFDGSRRERLPFEFKNGLLKISLDTAKLKDGPTVFFELAAE